MGGGGEIWARISAPRKCLATLITCLAYITFVMMTCSTNVMMSLFYNIFEGEAEHFGGEGSPQPPPPLDEMLTMIQNTMKLTSSEAKGAKI